MRGDIETVRRHGKWINVVHGTYDNQEDAAEQGRILAKRLGVEWFLRSRAGRWRLRNTYGHDPRRTRG